MPKYLAHPRMASLLIALCFTLPAHAADFTNDLGMEFVKIKQGCFMMGRDPNFEDGGNDELPRHRVCIQKDFFLGKTEVTQAEWVAVMGSNPSNFKGRDNPVEQVSWNDVQSFLERRNKQDSANRYRLPTEAEWEYAARAGTKSTYHWGDDAGPLGQHAWYDGNSGERTHPVAQLKPNPWGLYDMHGNVWEWVEDCYHESYAGAPSDGSAWTSSCYRYSDGGQLRVLRGGSWSNNPSDCRAANRIHYTPDDRNGGNGFRVVRLPR
jgi:formylglycine-generating enzyme required for sulfatase activity